jgi:hypothetical protein
MPSYSRRIDLPGKGSQELYDKVAETIDRFLEKAQIPGQTDISRDPGKKEVSVKSQFANATLVCGEGHIQVNASLSLFAVPFRSKLDEGINRWIGKLFNNNTPTA